MTAILTLTESRAPLFLKVAWLAGLLIGLPLIVFALTHFVLARFMPRVR